MLTVVTFKWRPVGGPPKYTSHHVNVLAAMVRRHYPGPHRFVCVTDDPKDLDLATVEAMPLWPDHGKLLNPHGPAYPSCYRRLKLFDPAIRELLGDRIVCLDIDCIITGDLAPLWDRDEDFVIWGGTNPTTNYNCSMMLMTAGARPWLWEEFDPKLSPVLAQRHQQFGSDQGWISYRLGKGEAMWRISDGVYAWSIHLQHGREPLPKNARVVFFNGKRHNPWDMEPQRRQWVRENWR